MNIVAGIIIGLIVLTVLVVIHEGGHFIMARKNGVRVKEFGIGFPPRAIAWKRGEDNKWHRFYKKDWEKESVTTPVLSKSKESGKKTSNKLIEPGLVFSINWLPIGGFCSMDGESDADTKKDTFGASSFWSKTKILFGGVLMNWIAAIVILTILSITGMPEFIENQFSVGADTRIVAYPVEVDRIEEGSPAEKSEMKTGDLIFAAKAENEDVFDIKSSYDVSIFNNNHKGKTVDYYVCSKDVPEISEDISAPVNNSALSYETNAVFPAGCGRTVRTATLKAEDGEYLLGISMKNTGATSRYSTWSAPIVGTVLTLQLTGETFRGLGVMVVDLFKGIVQQFSPDENVRSEGQASLKTAGDSVTGPVGILGMLFPSFISAGPTYIAFLAAVISISLACMNVLPIPALDGGRWLLIAIFKLRKKKLTTETENRIVSRAFMAILALAILITILDIIRLTR